VEQSGCLNFDLQQKEEAVSTEWLPRARFATNPKRKETALWWKG